MVNILESTIQNVKDLLNKQRENVEEFKKIVSESLNGETTSRKVSLNDLIYRLSKMLDTLVLTFILTF